MFMIAHDKANHFIYGQLASLFLVIFAPAPYTLYAATVACGVIAIGREIYNSISGGKFDLADIAWTLFGGAIPIIVAIKTGL